MMEAPTGWRRAMRAVRIAIYTHLIEPFTETYDPLPKVSWGATIGMFIGLLPIMGIQMYVVAAMWVVCRFVFRFEFNLGIAIAMVWISNPVTVLPLYFLYMETGITVLHALGRISDPIDFLLFKARLAHLGQLYAGDWLQQAVQSTVLLFWEFGWPIVIGSLVWALPFALLTFPLTGLALTKYRHYLAREEGLSYEDWAARNIVRRR